MGWRSCLGSNPLWHRWIEAGWGAYRWNWNTDLDMSPNSDIIRVKRAIAVSSLDHARSMRSPRDCPSVIRLTKAEHHSETQHSGTSCCSVTQSCPTLCDPKYTWLPCPPSPGACSNSCSLSQWCHPTISSSVTPFSSCLQSFPASGSFLMSWLFASGGQSIGAFSLASVLPMNIQEPPPFSCSVPPLPSAGSAYHSHCKGEMLEMLKEPIPLKQRRYWSIWSCETVNW